MAAPLYRWPGMTRREVRGTVRRRLRAVALNRSRMAPLAFAARALSACAEERARYLAERNPITFTFHRYVLEAGRANRSAA